jgi:hypothetical protein
MSYAKLGIAGYTHSLDVVDSKKFFPIKDSDLYNMQYTKTVMYPGQTMTNVIKNSEVALGLKSESVEEGKKVKSCNC